MKVSEISPLLFAGVMLAAGFAAATQSQAAQGPISDAAYVAEARCVGLSEGLDRGGPATPATVRLTQNFDAQSATRLPLAEVIADDARDAAAHEATISPYWRDAAAREVSQSCQALVQPAR